MTRTCGRRGGGADALHDAAQQVRPADRHAACAPSGAGPVGSLAGMLAGADSIDDQDLLWHGAMGKLLGGVQAPSPRGTLGRMK